MNISSAVLIIQQIVLGSMKDSTRAQFSRCQSKPNNELPLKFLKILVL